VARTSPGQNPRPRCGRSRDGWTTQHRLRLVAHRQRRRPRLCGEWKNVAPLADLNTEGASIARFGLKCRASYLKGHPLVVDGMN
jgi:hypothetical protein